MEKNKKNNDKTDNKAINEAIKDLKNARREQEDLAFWITKSKGISGFSNSAITKLKTEPNSRKNEQFLNLFKEYKSLNYPKRSDIDSITPELKEYLNQNFYIYSWDISRETNEPFISRVIMKIGNTLDSVEIENVRIEDNTNYKGVISYKSGGYIVLRLDTDFQKKCLTLIFHVGPDKNATYAIGCYNNINSDGAVVCGTAILEYKKDDNSLESKRITNEEKHSTSEHIINFFKSKENNYIKTRTKGLFTKAHFADFFREQEDKKIARLSRINVSLINNLFICHPLGNLQDDTFKDLKTAMNELVPYLINNYNLTVYYSARGLSSKEDMESPSFVTAEILQQLNTADAMFVIYPDKVVSSVLVELGYIIGQRKKCYVFFKKFDDLPFILRGEIPSNVQLISYKDNKQLISEIKKSAHRLFINKNNKSAMSVLDSL